MGRKLQIKSHYSVADLKARYRACCDPVEARRWQLIWLVTEGKTLTAAAEAIAFNYDYARDIVRSYNTDGADGLRNRRKDSRSSSPKALLTIEQCEELDQRLQTPPADGGVWSGPKVAQVIAEMTGREHVWPQRGWEYLKLLGYSCQSPRPRHDKADKAAQLAFKKTYQTAKQN